jgi:hypothetical protein
MIKHSFTLKTMVIIPNRREEVKQLGDDEKQSSINGSRFKYNIYKKILIYTLT